MYVQLAIRTAKNNKTSTSNNQYGEQKKKSKYDYLYC